MSDDALGFEHVHEPGTSGWTLLLLHGTGGDENDLLPLGRQLAPDAAVLSPRGQVLENGAPRFFARLAPGVLDLPDLHARTDALAEFVGAAAQEYGLDAKRVVAVGFSNGANIAASLLLQRPGVLRGAALWRPMLPYEPEAQPALAGTDVLIAAGARDPMSPLPGVQRLAAILEKGGAAVTSHVEPNAGHELTPTDLAATRSWLSALTG